MRIKGSKNKIKGFLILAVLAVWGIIIYNLINYINSSDSDSQLNNGKKSGIDNRSQTDKAKLINLDTVSFIELNKSPFELGKIVIEKPKIVTPKIVVKTTAPPKPKLNYQISGVIVSNNRRLVIFEDLTNNQTLFLSEGESYRNIVIEKIDVEKIILKENESEQLIVLKR
jgi:type II secretory pathway component PulC